MDNKSFLGGSNAERIRRKNLSVVFGHVHRTRGVTRSELAVATGLGRSAIKALVEELIARELVTEKAGGAGRVVGRPSPVVLPRGDRVNVLAIEIAVDAVSAAIVGAGGEMRQVVRASRPASRGGAATVRLIRELVQPLVAEIAANGAMLAGVGVSVYGIVDAGAGVVRFGPNLLWRDVPLAEMVRDALELRVPVVLANDADLGALAEHRRGLGRDNLVYISSEVGIGGGIIVDGRPLHGAAASGGEVGHMCVNPNGIACGCGSQGCWETEIGELALLRHALRPTEGNRHRAAGAVLRDAEEGDLEALRAVQTVGRWLAIGLGGVINIFSPDEVVLGGLLARAYPLMREILEEELARRVLPPLRDVIVRLPFVADAPLVGAAELALEAVLSDPAIVPMREDAA